MTDRDRSFVIRLAAVVLSVIVVGMVFTLLVGLFNKDVDNDQIFGILGPSFNTTIGCLVGLLGGMRMSSEKPNAPAA